MKIKGSKGLRITIAILVLIAGNYLIYIMFPSTAQQDSTSALGLFIGALLIGWYQQTLLYNWVYTSRLILNTIAFGIGCLLWTIPDLFITEFQRNPVKWMLLPMGEGFMFGLLLSLYDIISYQKRKWKAPYSGSEKPILSGKATRIYSVDNVQYGRIILLHDRLLFLSAGEPDLDILFSDIQGMEITSILTIQNKLIFRFNDAEIITFTLAMPGLWKKKISNALIDSKLQIAFNQ